MSSVKMFERWILLQRSVAFHHHWARPSNQLRHPNGRLFLGCKSIWPSPGTWVNHRRELLCAPYPHTYPDRSPDREGFPMSCKAVGECRTACLVLVWSKYHQIRATTNWQESIIQADQWWDSHYNHSTEIIPPLVFETRMTCHNHWAHIRERSFPNVLRTTYPQPEHRHWASQEERVRNV